MWSSREQDNVEERDRQRVLHNLAQKAKAMSIQLAPATTPVRFKTIMKINQLSAAS